MTTGFSPGRSSSRSSGRSCSSLIPRRNESAIKATALITTLVTFGFGIYMVADFDYDRSRALQFAVNRPWIDVINSRYHVGIDGISLPLLVLSMFITVALRHLQLGPLPRAPQPQGASSS